MASPPPLPTEKVAAPAAPPAPSLTLGEAYEQYLSDPTQAWSPRTREAYETSRRLAVSVIGEDVPIHTLARAHCRDYIDVLRFMPRNAAKRFPQLTARQAADRARTRGDTDLISAANANTCLANLSSFLNWAVNEELLGRNPMRGLRLPDDTAKKDKRFPFSPEQLRAIFDAPLYRGCLDGERGYAKPGYERPRNARFWVPLIGLHTGMRLNEICQLDVADVRLVDGIRCLAITENSVAGSTDKNLKTGASERLIPIHRNLIDCGLLAFVEKQRRNGRTKLFEEIDPGTKGIRAVAFSKWFTQFLRSCGAYQARTCFHSFRHNFRDELRSARIEHDVAMALGGWTSGSGKRGASENYGNGHRIAVLEEAVSKLAFSDIDISHLALHAR
ncbi:tyrosine-type recombinase/integrase, partial [Sphingomonas xinjiangensis]